MKKNQKSKISRRISFVRDPEWKIPSGKNQKWMRGFTLVELLIVIAIIGILAALLMSNFIGVRQRARDAQRKADLRQIQSALEIYRSDNATYASAGSPGVLRACGTALQNPGLTTTYMAKLPCDSNSAYNSGNYYFSGTGPTYILAACLENTGDISTEIEASPGGTGTCASGKYYVLRNP